MRSMRAGKRGLFSPVVSTMGVPVWLCYYHTQSSMAACMPAWCQAVGAGCEVRPTPAPCMRRRCDGHAHTAHCALLLSNDSVNATCPPPLSPQVRPQTYHLPLIRTSSRPWEAGVVDVPAGGIRRTWVTFSAVCVCVCQHDMGQAFVRQIGRCRCRQPADRQQHGQQHAAPCAWAAAWAAARCCTCVTLRRVRIRCSACAGVRVLHGANAAHLA